MGHMPAEHGSAGEEVSIADRTAAPRRGQPGGSVMDGIRHEAMRGGCLCGAVRFETTLTATESHACHCEICRRWVGSALVCVTVPPDDIRFEGAENIRSYRSSEWAERAWCERCGTTLYYHLLVGPQNYEVALGAFDAPNGVPMTLEIFIDRKPDGYAFAGDHPRWTKAETEAAFASAGEGT